MTAARRSTRNGRPPAAWLPWTLLLLGATLTAALEPPLRAARPPAAETSAAGHAGQPLWVQYVIVGLGGFRGVIAEVLWLRAGRLQEQGRYLEMVQLAEWITALDPRAGDAWAYHAWNLAYNISAMMPRHEDRLRWVAAGVSLLRDRALRANPHNASLHRELGWLYQHKIGGDLDPAHILYKLSLAAEMNEVLAPDGRPPPPGSDGARALAENYSLEVETMREIEARFGPLDWRLPQSHAIYWAWRGLRHARGFELQACRRMIHQNLIAAIEGGRFTGDLQSGRFATAGRTDLIAPTADFLEETVRLFPGERRVCAFFLAYAVRKQHQAGNEAAARGLYDRLRALAGEETEVPGYEKLLEMPRLDDDFFRPRTAAAGTDG